MKIPILALNNAYSQRVKVLVSEVHVAEPFDPKSSPKPPHLTKFLAIWDTGATNTVITTKVAQDCGLKPTGMTRVNTANDVATKATYLASIWLPNNVCFPQLRVTEGTIAGGVDILIGMDVINKGDFAVTNKDNKTNLSFRMPSIECIDFVQQASSIKKTGDSKAMPKVSRNAPCPCGSGKKYKRCCGR